jgi:hypothetical protein
LQLIASECRERASIGDGELHRLARRLIKENHLFDAPDIPGSPRTQSKYG